MHNSSSDLNSHRKYEDNRQFTKQKEAKITANMQNGVSNCKIIPQENFEQNECFKNTLLTAPSNLEQGLGNRNCSHQQCPGGATCNPVHCLENEAENPERWSGNDISNLKCCFKSTILEQPSGKDTGNLQQCSGVAISNPVRCSGIAPESLERCSGNSTCKLKCCLGTTINNQRQCLGNNESNLVQCLCNHEQGLKQGNCKQRQCLGNNIGTLKQYEANEKDLHLQCSKSDTGKLNQCLEFDASNLERCLVSDHCIHKQCSGIDTGNQNMGLDCHGKELGLENDVGNPKPCLSHDTCIQKQCSGIGTSYESDSMKHDSSNQELGLENDVGNPKPCLSHDTCIRNQCSGKDTVKQTQCNENNIGNQKQCSENDPGNHKHSLEKDNNKPNITNEASNQSLSINNVSNACWFFHAQVGKIEMPLLFDTGSPVSIISKEVYENMATDKPSLTSIDTTLLTANGTQLEILGQGTFELKTEVKTYDWKFLIANLEGNMGIIGQDFIDSQGRSLKWKNLTWQTKAGIIKLFKLNSTQVARILVSQPVSIAPESETFLTAHTNYPLYKDLNMIEPFSSNQKKGLLVARSLINNEGESKISVLNLTDKPIKLKTGDILGNACPVTENCHENETIRDNSEIRQLPEHLQPLVDELSPELSSEEKQQFTDLISEYQDIFMGPDKKLGQTDLAYHKIEVGNAKPIKIPPRKCPLAQREIINEELDKMLAQKIVEPSDSP